MAVGTGYSKVTTNGLVFAYDVGDNRNSFKGAPTTNICTGEAYSIYNSGATNYRNNTEVAPPVAGYEVVKVVADTQGTYGQSILWRAPYATSPVMTITNSVYAYLSAGSYVQVGQHWFPWNYGSAQYIPKNQWVRISETYAINDGGSYGSAAMVYSTDGIAYFSMPQYEMKPYMTPFVGFNTSRDSSQALYNLNNNSALDVSNVSFDSTGNMVFDGSNDYINMPASNVFDVSQVTVEVIVKPNGLFQYGFWFEKGAVNTQYSLFMEGSSIVWRQAVNSQYTSTSTMTNNAWNHVVGTFKSGERITYVNGTQRTADSLSYTLNTGQGNQFIGSYNSGAYYYNGYIAIVKVYNRALPAEEVRDNYNHYKTRFNLS